MNGLGYFFSSLDENVPTFGTMLVEEVVDVPDTALICLAFVHLLRDVLVPQRAVLHCHVDAQLISHAVAVDKVLPVAGEVANFRRNSV